MTTHEFVLIASGVDPFTPGFEDVFFEAGCDDATISFQKGAIILDFAREADTLAMAIASAVDDVRKAGAYVERIEPDPLVTLSDIAKRSGLTRAAISNYASGERGTGFPPPVLRVTTESPLWEWVAVAGWLIRQGKIEDASILSRAQAVRNANDALEAARLEMAAA